MYKKDTEEKLNVQEIVISLQNKYGILITEDKITKILKAELN